MVSTTNLVAYYKCDENAANTTITDAHSNSYDGVASTNTSNWYNASGKINSTWDIDPNEYGQITNESAMRLSSGSYTISFWTKMADVDPTNHDKRCLWKSYSTTGNVSYDIGPLSGNMRFRTNGGTCTSGALSDNTWYHVVCVRDLADTGSEQRLYINGSSVDTAANTNTTATGDDNEEMQIGRYYFGTTGGGYFDGQIDEIGIWSRALTSTEVSDLYNSGNGLAYPFVSDVDFNATALALSLSDESPVILISVPGGALGITSSLGTPNVAIDVNFAATVQALSLALEEPTPKVLRATLFGGVGSPAVSTRYPVDEGLTAVYTKQTGKPNL